MDDTVGAPGSTDPPSDLALWRGRLAADRATMDSLRTESARISGEIAATERAVADTMRTLAEQDRARGRRAAADRRAARAREAEVFAEHESAAAREFGERLQLSGDDRGAVRSSRVHP